MVQAPLELCKQAAQVHAEKGQKRAALVTWQSKRNSSGQPAGQRDSQTAGQRGSWVAAAGDGGGARAAGQHAEINLSFEFLLAMLFYHGYRKPKTCGGL